MKYIQARGIEEDERYYFEIDEKGTAYRQIVVTGENSCQISTAPDFMLSDQEVTMYDGDVEIDAEAFERIWRQATEPNRAPWKITKQQYAPGNRVSGAIAMFYPQGIIIRINEQTYAVTDDEELRKRTPWNFLYPDYRIEGTVTGYDENNFWLVLEDCVISGEKI
ncbi:hypothetical protein G8C92_12695 [Paenibacillus donghaensis]|uniref:hypothetical protein n=1 Tax=Paenibacillus donghaensis TaxID=414771 RepID=UPI001883B246|nr:hypothetical protein [Paenibacillus donghaensis]MBE9914894.1 hypothetical protein [Paenibacillus donghaensis]